MYLTPSPFNIIPIGCPETSVRKYHYSLRNDPEESSSQVHIRFTVTVLILLDAHWDGMWQSVRDFINERLNRDMEKKYRTLHTKINS